MKKRVLFLMVALGFTIMQSSNVFSIVATQYCDTITSNKDNTINESPAGVLANSTGLIYVGNVAKTDSITRRGLVQFDLSAIPSGATVDSVKLVMSLQASANMTIEMYSVSANWGEGTSYSGGGLGVAPTTNDVTWLHSFYSGTTWTTPGGDYDATMAFSATITSIDTEVTFSSDNMKSNVAAWVSGSASNYGWLLKSSDETTASKGVIAKLYSKETATTEAQKPTLYVYYTSTTTETALVEGIPEISLYPMPAVNVVTVATTEDVVIVEILDISGKTVMTAYESTINVSALPSGVYIAKVTTTIGVVATQLIKK